MAAEGRNRRALGDIGNVVTVRGVEGKPQPQATRPITRSFCAQLLANAQAAKAQNNKNGEPAPRRVIPKPKATFNPKDIIVISPDTEELKKEKIEKNRKGNNVTLTATLTARSKAACGIKNKPKDQIVNIDVEDMDNELAVVEYIEDMYKFYKLAEQESRIFDYMEKQPEINEKMRAILIDWLIDVHRKFELHPETLYLTINLVDRFLEKKQTSRRELQLLGVGAMLVASKYEEIWAPEVNDFVRISDKAYTHEQVLGMEKRILGELEWYLTVPTPYVFLVRFIKASGFDSDMEEHLVYFLAELGLMNYETIVYCPSLIAASAVYVARLTLHKSVAWTETLKLHTGFEEKELMDCAKMMVRYHGEAVGHKLKVIYRKYSNVERGSVALLPAATIL